VLGKEESAKIVADLKEQHAQEYHELEAKFENVRKRLTEQIDQLTERNQELELSMKI
jgi:molecular chaperone GrpE (heat shock protein)